MKPERLYYLCNQCQHYEQHGCGMPNSPYGGWVGDPVDAVCRKHNDAVYGIKSRALLFKVWAKAMECDDFEDKHDDTGRADRPD